MALNFSTTAKSALQNGVKILCYGRAGVGKTTLIKTAPEPLILSAEAGLLSLRDVDIPCLEIATIEDLTDAYNFVRDSDDAKKFKTICLDSITEIGEVILTNAKEQEKSKGSKGDIRRAYGDLIERVTVLVKAFRDLKGKHVYFSAQEEKTRDDNGITTIAPSMPGAKVGGRLPFWFDEVLHLAIGQTADGQSYRYLRTAPDLFHEAKDRSGALDEIEEPDLGKIFDKILNKK